jgi:hypothetical protein
MGNKGVGGLAAAAAVAAGIAFIVAAGLLSAARPDNVVVACQPVSYAFEGAPPPTAVSEFERALTEIGKRTRLVFVPAPLRSAHLVVMWSDRAVGGASASHTGTAAGVVGYGHGVWRTVGHIDELVGGTISVDGTVAWATGLDRGNSLGSVFVHELGHVVGLPHSAVASSFMHNPAGPGRPEWSPDDLRQLESVGTRAGCP